ncbi:TMV resistance protein N [Artemisia annua]|uniref:TMV resistance protein N n=1 Tax=Artemisia annua TaxID=35608 RepID=A0A2U1NAC8_ARTAN|nr:TMV resistance protein N [Artemisia annua]
MDPSSSSSSNKRKRGLDCYDEPRYQRPKYDVFVNYAPEEIGNGFASHLKGALGREGFTICDHTKLPNGQDKSSELLKAIEDSEIYLVVFSPSYASSKECLDEFVLIMESYPKFNKRKFFPIFFNVEPSHVRNQQGSFLEAFQGHEKNVDAERVQIWRQALKEAGDKSGLNLKADWPDEEWFIQKIVKDVRKMQNPQQLCYVEHPVGIDSRAQDIISALRLSDPAFTMVAVLGMSGSGKTTIAKAVYDRIAADFDVSCFIENIHCLYTGQNWEVKLQRDAIYRLMAGKNKFKGSDGVAKLIKLLSGQKVLLILDDVYEFKQLQALSIHLASFHDGSRIIVTTRNKLSLSNLPHTPYNIRLLDTIESFELFTRLIGKGDPIDMKFVEEIVQCAGGIPLVLEVWSRHFTCYDRNLWPDMLEMLKIIPHEDTQKKLQISYDSLPKRGQNFFLDIACFFHGMDKDTIVKVLQDKDFFPNFEIQNLVHKFLVKIHFMGEVILHDVIKEMGKEVVRRKDEGEPGKRTRLMGYRDVVRVLRDSSVKEQIQLEALSCVVPSSCEYE